MKKKEKYIIFILIIILLLIDQITKIVAIKQGWIIKNSNDSKRYYILISIIIVFMLIRYIFNNNSFIKTYTRVILSFGISGGIGNIIDRIWNKNVILFINLNNNIELNISYIYILIAWIGMAVILTKDSAKFLQDKKIKRNDKKDENSSK